jgi:hypothetical protein
LAVILLAAVAIGHLLRLLLRADIVAAGFVVPMWASALACVVFGGTAYLLWHASRTSRG